MHSYFHIEIHALSDSHNSIRWKYFLLVLGKIKLWFMALGKNSSLAFNSQILNYNMLVHMLVNQIGQLDLLY